MLYAASITVGNNNYFLQEFLEAFWTPTDCPLGNFVECTLRTAKAIFSNVCALVFKF